MSHGPASSLPDGAHQEAASLIRQLFSLRYALDETRRTQIEDALVDIGALALPNLVQALRPTMLRALAVFVFRAEPACHAASALGRIGDRCALPILLSVVFRDRDLHSRRMCYAAAQALAQLADQREVEALCDALESISRPVTEELEPKDELQRKAAAQSAIVRRLSELGDLRAVPCLLEQGNADYITDESLARFGPPVIPHLLQALATFPPHTADKALRALIKLGRDASPTLFDQVKRPVSACTCRCAIALCHLGRRELELIPLVVHALDKSWSRGLALDALALLAEKVNHPMLRAALPTLQRLALKGRIRRSVGLVDPRLLVCERVISRIEQQTVGVKNLPVISASDRGTCASLPVVGGDDPKCWP